MLDRLRTTMSVLWREVAKFGVVGLVAFVVDFGGFNLLNSGPLAGKVTTAKIISGAAGTVVAWLGNRYWTFRHRRSRPVAHEIGLFFGVNAVALGLGAAWLAGTHYLLGLDSLLASNVNAIIGIGIGTVFRFAAYRRLVFAHEELEGPQPSTPDQRGVRAGSSKAAARSIATPASDRKSANRAG